MATTYTLIDKTILTADQASVSFTGLGSYSSDYTDLLVKYSARGDSNTSLKLSFNGVTTNLSDRYLFGAGSGSPASGTDSYIYLNDLNPPAATANTFGNGEAYIPNFSSSNYKSVSADSVTENNGTTAYIMLTAGLWSSTAAITSIQLSAGSGNIVSGSSFYLYGIKNS